MLTRLIDRVLKVVMNRRFWGVLLLVAAAVFAVTGDQAVRRVLGQVDTAGFIREWGRKLQAEDPEAARILARLTDDKEKEALAATLRVADQSGGIKAVAEVARRAGTGRSPADLRLARITFQKGLRNREDIEAFLSAYSTALERLEEAGGAAGEVLNVLEEASRTDDLWPVVRDDPVALAVLPIIAKDQKLRTFYQANREWLAELLTHMVPEPEDEPSDPATRKARVAAAYAEVLRAACTYDPLPRQAVEATKNLDGGRMALCLFVEWGATIQIAVARLGVPLVEALDVLWTNSDFFEPQDLTPEKLASHLADLKRRKPSVWEAARTYPLALRLDKDVPDLADKLLKEHGFEQVAAFLYAKYEREIAPAARAVVCCGDLALYALNRWSEDRDFRSFLLDQKRGFRSVCYVAMFGDQGVSQLRSNPSWLKKYFSEDCKPLVSKTTIIESLPLIGGIATVVKNWVDGIPSTWGEIGWAAMDVADCALLLASFGTSSAASVAVGGARQAPRTVARKGAVKGARTLAREEVAERMLTTWRTLAKGASRAARKEARKAAARGASSGVRRFLTAVKGAAGRAGSLVIRIGRWTVTTPPRVLVSGARTTLETWRMVPPAIRLCTYRGLCAAILLYTLQERTLPALPDAGEQVGRWAGEVVRKGGQAAGAALAAAIQEAFLPDREVSAGMTRFVLWVSVIVLAGLGLMLILSKKPGLAPVD